jgi:hypothetical protein
MVFDYHIAKTVGLALWPESLDQGALHRTLARPESFSESASVRTRDMDISEMTIMLTSRTELALEVLKRLAKRIQAPARMATTLPGCST